MSVPVEQLKRERTRALVIAVLEVVLGVIMLYVGVQVLSVGEIWRRLMSSMMQYAAGEILQMYSIAWGITTALGFFALIHGIKRMVDNLLNAWVKSAVPKVQHEASQ